MGGGVSQPERQEAPYDVSVESGAPLGIETESSFFGAAAVVRRVRPEGAASADGRVLPGDVIVGINGVNTCALSFEDTMTALRSARYPVRVTFAPPEWYHRNFSGAVKPTPAAKARAAGVQPETDRALAAVGTARGGVTTRCAVHVHGQVPEGVGVCAVCQDDAEQLRKLKIFMQQREFESQAASEELGSTRHLLSQRERALDEAVGERLRVAEELARLRRQHQAVVGELDAVSGCLRAAEDGQRAASEEALSARMTAEACRQELSALRAELEQLRARRNGRLRRSLKALARMGKQPAEKVGCLGDHDAALGAGPVAVPVPVPVPGPRAVLGRVDGNSSVQESAAPAKPAKPVRKAKRASKPAKSAPRRYRAPVGEENEFTF